MQADVCYNTNLLQRGSHGPQRSRMIEASLNRRGVALLAAIVCLAVVTAICASLIRVVHAQRHQTRLEEQRLQADWLAEAGLERAAAKLRSAEDYSGETWQIAEAEFSGRGSGTVAITVERITDQPGKRLIRVQADFPANLVGRARQSKLAVMKIAERKSGAEQ